MADLRDAAQAVVDYVTQGEPGSGHVVGVRLSNLANALRAALRAAPPAGLREDERDRALQIAATAPDTEVGRLIVRLVGIAAPSCGHPIDAERLARALEAAYTGGKPMDMRYYRQAAAAIAASYGGEEKS